MKTIIIDDEPFAIETLKHMLEPYKEIDILGTYTEYDEALSDIQKIKPEIIFLDIELGEMNGLELAEVFIKELNNVEIVFVTAYSQYAVDAFEINAIDYLLKPIQERRLKKAIKRLTERKSQRSIFKEEIDTSNKLKIISFGGFQVIDSKENLLSWRTQKSKELFAYLWTRLERPSSKDLIIDTIFPDRQMDKASTILHTTVYQLRKNLEKLGYENAIIYSEEGYQLDLPIESDLENLKNIVWQEKYNENDIGEILKIYKGDFLEEGYTWAMELQQTYRHLVFKIMEIFASDEIEKEKFNAVLKISLDKLYEINPLEDSTVEMLLDYYGKQGQTAKLKDFYKSYEKQLWEEIEEKPTRKIKETYKKYISN